MDSYNKQVINPMKMIKKLFGDIDTSYITFNPDIKCLNRDYYRIETSTHDGTFVFIYEMLGKLLYPIVNLQSYKVGTEKQLEKSVRFEYEIGNIHLASVYGLVELPVGKHFGQRDRARMAVKCNIITKDQTND